MAALPLQNLIAQTSSFEKKYRARIMRLGDGMSQRVQDGLNAAYYVGTITYSQISLTDLQTITAFLDSIGSWGTFTYTPLGATSAVTFAVDTTSNGPSITIDSGNYYSITFKVRQEVV